MLSLSIIGYNAPLCPLKHALSLKSLGGLSLRLGGLGCALGCVCPGGRGGGGVGCKLFLTLEVASSRVQR